METTTRLAGPLSSSATQTLAAPTRPATDASCSSRRTLSSTRSSISSRGASSGTTGSGSFGTTSPALPTTHGTRTRGGWPRSANELEKLDRSLYRQSLGLEEHDPAHPTQ